MSASRAPRRLPGFRFETQAPTLPEVLPRMDVTVFVGFSASGPLQVPVAVESEAQFTAIFGQDAPLAVDVERSEQVYAHLAPAVRAFFRNNGRRCWVIRVARQRAPFGAAQKNLNYARYNYFPIPALARAEFANGKLKRITPAFARARSEGSWSDSLRVGSALLTRSLQISSVTMPHSESPLNDSEDYLIKVDRLTAQNLGPGDLLKMTFQDDQKTDRSVLFLVAAKADPAISGTPDPTVDIIGRKAVWFEIVSPISLPPPGTKVKAAAFTREADSKSSKEDDIVDGFECRPPWTAVLNPQLTSPATETAPTIQQSDDQTVMLQLSNCPAADVPPAGSVIRIDLAAGTLWMTVAGLAFSSGEAGTAFVWGQAFKEMQAPSTLPSLRTCDSLSFETWVRKGEEYSVSLSDLGFEAAHDRYWASLPSDKQVYGDPDPSAADPPATVLWRQTGDLFRFPLAGIHQPDEVYFPLSMPAIADNFLGPVMLEGDPLERDGLAKFDAGLFIDRDLFDTQTIDLSGQADYLRYLSPRPRRLTGMHAAFSLEEATIISVPDAVHRSWSPQPLKELPEPEVSSPPLRPDWWTFLDCQPPAKAAALGLSDCDPKPAEPSLIKPVHKPEWGNFLSCSIQIINPPILSISTKISADGNVGLSWIESPPAAAIYLLQESGSSNFTDAETIYSGPLTSYTLYGRKPGDYYYRVQAIVNGNTSDWSNGVSVRVGDDVRWELDQRKDYSPSVLLAVQRSLLRMCAARGDLFCVLSLPEDYRDDKAIEHVTLLKATPNIASPTERVSPLGFGEVNDFSYGAVFHPWLIEREDSRPNNLTRMPPCGAVSGLIADRALRRGAWLAAANQTLRGVVALEPALNPARRLDLQDAHINLVRQEPRGFLVLDSDTLAEDDLRPINVRRLLILLRRQALRLGATYVFEPNSPAFRRMVDRGFTEMLDGLFERGAFAGATPASSYQVVTDGSLNTEASVDQGRFIVELRVAPSLPMTFLTIRLVQTGDLSVATEVR